MLMSEGLYKNQIGGDINNLLIFIVFLCDIL